MFGKCCALQCFLKDLVLDQALAMPDMLCPARPRHRTETDTPRQTDRPRQIDRNRQTETDRPRPRQTETETNTPDRDGDKRTETEPSVKSLVVR